MKQVIVEWWVRIYILAFKCDRIEITAGGVNTESLVAPHQRGGCFVHSEREGEENDYDEQDLARVPIRCKAHWFRLCLHPRVSTRCLGLSQINKIWGYGRMSQR